MKQTVLSGKTIRLYPNTEQTKLIAQCCGSTRWLWNQMLDMQTKRHNNGGKLISRYGMNYILPVLKKEHPWLKNAESTSLQNTNAHLFEAYKRFFNGVSKKPKFKKKRYTQSFTINYAKRNI